MQESYATAISGQYEDISFITSSTEGVDILPTSKTPSKEHLESLTTQKRIGSDVTEEDEDNQ